MNEVGYGDPDGQTADNQNVRPARVLGAGAEHAVSPGTTAKLEYLCMNFGSYEGFSENREDYSFENPIDMVRAGLNFKF